MEFPAPNVNIATVSAFSNAVSVSIRGISNSDIDSTVDPPVAMFVDGVYIPRPVASSLDLFDVEQIEVLRGPQGTLFGRNTSAGAIQVRTRRPSGDHSNVDHVPSSMLRVPRRSGALGSTATHSVPAIQPTSRSLGRHRGWT